MLGTSSSTPKRVSVACVSSCRGVWVSVTLLHLCRRNGALQYFKAFHAVILQMHPPPGRFSSDSGPCFLQEPSAIILPYTRPYWESASKKPTS
jgi:hypothetical protein